MGKGKVFPDVFGGALNVGVRSAPGSGRERAVWVGEAPLSPGEARRLASWLRTCADTAENEQARLVIDPDGEVDDLTRERRAWRAARARRIGEDD